MIIWLIWLLLVPFFIPSVGLAFEILAVGWNRSSLRHAIFERDRSGLSDLIFFGFQVAGLREGSITVFSLGLAYVTGALTHFIVQSTVGLNTRIRTGHVVADVFLYLLVFTLFDYWSHRLEHAGPIWYLHRLHHSATSLSPMVSARNHPVELALEPFVKVWPLAFFSIAPGYLLLISSADQFYQYLVHTDVRWSWGWFGRWVLVSPLAHRIHHSPLPEHFDKNFSMLTAWDRVFGTWYGGTVINEAVGIHNAQVHNNSNLLYECILDVKQFYNSLRADAMYGCNRLVRRREEESSRAQVN